MAMSFVKSALGYRALSRLAGLLALLFGLATSPLAVAQEDVAFSGALEALNAHSYKDVEKAIKNLATIDNPRVEEILHALLDGDLYYRLADGRVVVVADSEGKYRLTDAINGESLGTTGRFDVKKVRVNNHLRSVLRDLIARINLDSKDPERRLKAVRQMTGDNGSAALSMLRDAAVKERDDEVKRAIDVALALNDLQSDDAAIRLKAVRTLDGSKVLSTLLGMVSPALERGYDHFRLNFERLGVLSGTLLILLVFIVLAPYFVSTLMYLFTLLTGVHL